MTAIRRALLLTRVQGMAFDALAVGCLGGALGALLGRSGLGALGGVALGTLLGLRWTVARTARAIERDQPGLRDALLAWLEGSGGELRGHLERWLDACVTPAPLWAGLGRTAVAALLWAVVPALTTPTTPGTEPLQAARPVPAALAVSIHVEPPAYSGLPARDLQTSPVKALRGSRLTLTWRTGAEALLLSEPGGVEERLVVAHGETVQTVRLERDRTLRATTPDGAARVLLQLEATPDEPPAVDLLAPEADRLVTAAPAAFEVRAQATDDLGVARASLHYTLAQGSGESVHFKTGRLLAATSRDDPRRVVLTGRVNPLALGMAAGDTLVLWAEAADGNTVDGPSVRRSGARLLRWEIPVPLLSGGTGAMPPPPRSLLTQRELLKRTERVVRQRLRGAALAEAAAELAQDQRSLRMSFGQVLSEDSGEAIELDFDQKESFESADVRARAFLTAAVSAMWESESELEVTRPDRSVPAQRAAVKALDAAFQLVRYSLRPFAQPDKPVDETRRLTGASKGLAPRAGTAGVSQQPDPALVSLALTLLGAAARGVDAAEARTLGDAVWALPADSGVPAPELASALYAAADEPARSAAARTAGEALARRVRPARLTRPPADAEGARVVARVPLR